MKRIFWTVMAIAFPFYVIGIVYFFIHEMTEFSMMKAIGIAGVVMTSIIIEILLILKVCFCTKTHPYSYE